MGSSTIVPIRLGSLQEENVSHEEDQVSAPPRAPAAITEVLRLLHDLMNGKRFTAPEAAQRYRYQEPAVRRHLRAIQGVFREVVADKAGRALTYRFVWPRDKAAAPTAVLALELARAALISLRGSALDGELASLVEDHLRRTPDTARWGGDLGRMFFSRTRVIRSLGVDADVVDRIAACILERRQVACEYEHFGGKVDKVRLEPWTLVPSEEGLFCFARCADSDQAAHVDTRRLYKVARMRKVRKSQEVFAYPPADAYDPAQVFRHCFGIFLPEEGAQPERVELRFDPRWQAWLRHDRLHETQEGPAPTPDGKLQVTLTVYLTLDLARWLRGVGREVEVVAPPALRAWVRDEQRPPPI